MKRIVIAIDSFKGSLSSAQAAEAVAEGFKEILPQWKVEIIPIADGGEGSIDTISICSDTQIISTYVSDPLGRQIEARYAILDGTKAAIELATAAGLALLSPSERNPLQTTTYGMGELIKDGYNRGCREFLLLIGGSATNDGGVGLLSALGFRFLDCNGNILSGGGQILEQIAEIDGSAAQQIIDNCRFTVACDVDNPLYGQRGAAVVYGPQKGADKDAVDLLDRGLKHYAEVIKQYNGVEIATMPGAGAAGGVGGAITALLGGTMTKGIDAILNIVNFDERIKGCDLIITGEGKIDYQTPMGKAASGILRRAKAYNIPTIAIGGAVEMCDELQHCGFEAIYASTPNDMPLEQAMQIESAKNNLKNVAKQIATMFSNK